MLTQLLEKAFHEAAKLPAEEQDALAEIEAEKRWDDLLAGSQDLLERWVEEALAEHRAGKTIPVDLRMMLLNDL